MIDVDDVIDFTALERQQPNDRRLRELILYIAERSRDDQAFGVTKLNKLLFYIDFTSYVERGKSITGQRYSALQQGPVPSRILHIRRQMMRDGELDLEDSSYGPYHQHRPRACRKPDLSDFNPEEMAFIDSVLERWQNATAKEMSEMSHKFLGWKLSRQGEEIPYEFALLDRFDPSEDEIEHAHSLEQVAREHLAQCVEYPF